MPRDRASHAPSSTAAQSCSAPANGTSTGPGPTTSADDDPDVARRLVEQREKTRVLEQPVGRVDEEEIGVLLAGEPRDVDPRRH